MMEKQKSLCKRFSAIAKTTGCFYFQSKNSLFITVYA